MERVLVAMDPVRTHFFAASHALNLAKRVKARVFFLLVFPAPHKQSGKPDEKEKETVVKEKVEALIEEARSEGIMVEYYLAYGDYERELVSFVQDNNVTLLVVECPLGRGDPGEASKELLDKLRHRINCRIEVVNQKVGTLERKG